MKRIIIITVLALAACDAVRAQDSSRPYHEEINFMYGIPSISGYALGIVDVLVGAGSELIGAFSTEYFHYNASARFAYGAAGVYECLLTTKDNDEGDKVRTTQNLFSILPVGKVEWFNTKHFGMYSKVGAGVQMVVDNSMTEDKVSVLFAFQANPLCIEAGGDSVRGFAEFGWGMQGMMHAGIRFNF